MTPVRVEESIEQYHDNQAASHSKLRTFHKKGPRAYYLRHVKGGATEPKTEALILGQAFEDYLSDNLAQELATGLSEDFQSRYAIKPEGFNGRTKDGKAWLATMRATGTPVIGQDDVEMFERMMESIKELPGVWELLQGAQPQLSYRVDYPGIPGLQSRPDWTLPDNPLLGIAHVDLKTCLDLDGIDKAITTFGYHTQAACVRMTTRVDGYFLLAVEKSFPNRAQLVHLSDDFIQLGERWVERQLGGIRACYESNTWPRVIEPTRVAHPPMWLKELESAA